MKNKIKLTLLAENTASGKGIIGEHGIAIWIETGEHHVLFDTGQGMALHHNAEQLGIDLSTADAIVLSHGHYDHVGGLPRMLEQAPGAAFLGGLHLLAASEERMQQTILELKKRLPAQMVFCHCTGAKAVCRLHHEFPASTDNGHAGMKICLQGIYFSR